MTDTWSQGDAYEAYVGRWSRRLAPAFAEWAGVREGTQVLDVGCGTGALAEAALARGGEVTGVDLSPGYVDAARARLGGDGARFEVADATKLPFPDASFDAAVSGLVLNFVPEPGAMLREMRRVARPGGIVAVYVWDYAGKMEMIRRFWDAAIALDPAASKEDEATRFPMCHPPELARLFTDAGLPGVETRPLELETVFHGFDDYWAPFLGGQGPAPSYLARLDEKSREALREELRSRLPVDQDGHIRLLARAWGARARAPA